MGSDGINHLTENFRRETVDCNGIRLHYARCGQGEPVLLWHGFLGTWNAWRKLIPILSQRYTVIVPDMRGYGDSSKPATGYDGRTLAEDFYQLTCQLHFDRIRIVAHDMGAPPALILAGACPDRVSQLVYLDEPILTTHCLGPLFQPDGESWRIGGLWWWPFSLATNMPELLIAGREKDFLDWFYQHYAANPEAIEPAARSEYLRTFAGPGGIAGALGVYRALFETIQQTEALVAKKIEIPVLALGGERSLGDHTRQMLCNVATKVEGGIIPQSGHFIPEEQPHLLADRLTRFFEQGSK